MLLAPWSPHKDGRQIAGDINLDPGCVRQIAGDINKDPGPRAVAPGGRGIILSYLSRDKCKIPRFAKAGRFEGAIASYPGKMRSI